MEFLGDDASDALKTFVRHTPSMILVTGPNGEIFWTNTAFEQWSQYTAGELKALGWKRLSVDDADLQADIDAVQECVEGRRTWYTCRKQYRPKSSPPQHGALLAVRYPLVGELKWFFCIWRPLTNGRLEAFTLAMEHIERHTKRVDQMQTDLTAILSRMEERNSRRDQVDEDSRLAGDVVKWAKSHPRVVLAMLGAFASTFGLNQLLELVKTLMGIGN